MIAVPSDKLPYVCDCGQFYATLAAVKLCQFNDHYRMPPWVCSNAEVLHFFE